MGLALILCLIISHYNVYSKCIYFFFLFICVSIFTIILYHIYLNTNVSYLVVYKGYIYILVLENNRAIQIIIQILLFVTVYFLQMGDSYIEFSSSESNSGDISNSNVDSNSKNNRQIRWLFDWQNINNQNVSQRNNLYSWWTNQQTEFHQNILRLAEENINTCGYIAPTDISRPGP